MSRLCHLHIAIGLCCLGLLQGTVSYAQSASVNTPKDATANLVAQRALTALGATQIQTGEGVLVSGTLNVSGNKPAAFPIVLKSRGTAQLRTELTTSTGVRVTIVSNGSGKIIQPDGSVRWLTPDNTISQRITHIPVLSLLAEYQQPTVSTQYLGTTSIDSTTADVVGLGIFVANNVVSAQQQSQNTQHLFYIDHASGLLLRVQELHYAENVNGDSQGLETRFSDYRAIQNVMIPFHQQTYVDGQLLFDLSLTNVTLPVSLTDSDFSL
jgi:hypothetical protein